jgi:hypothetical protein
LNELQEAQRDRLSNLILSTVGNSIIGGTISITGANLTINGGYGFCKNGVVKISQLVCVLSVNTKVIMRITEHSVDYTDTLHKYGNLQDAEIKNHILDPRIDMETTRRKVLEYNLITVPASTALNPNNDILIAQIGSPVTNIIYLINTMPLGLKDAIEELQKSDVCQ